MDGANKCGGSVIADRLIATASHCVRTCPDHCSRDWDTCAERASCYVKLREYNDLERDTETIHTIKNVFYAPNGDTDIAVVELQDSVNSCTESDRECWTISPLKLPAPELEITPGQSVRTLGWGHYQIDGSDIIRQADFTFNSTDGTGLWLYTNTGIYGEEVCGGDSGGPLLLRDEEREYVLIGILRGAGGPRCDDFELIPGLPLTDWSKVSVFTAWMRKLISGPDSLTVRSSGAAGRERYEMMGVYRNTGHLHNHQPVWVRHDGTVKMFYDNAGRWMIGDPAVDAGGVSTVSAGHTEWPHKIHKWKFALNRKWQLAPLLTVTEGPPPGYPESIVIKDLTGEKTELAGVYRRQGDSRLWKYREYELRFDGSVWCVTGLTDHCSTVTGWDYTEDHVWPQTDTLYIPDFPDLITISSSGPAAEKYPYLMGKYEIDKTTSAMMRPVYKKTDEDYYIYYDGKGFWAVGPDVTVTGRWIGSEDRGRQSIPTTGWNYAPGSRDDSLKFTY